jgi:long-chain acyl-CoA synthetase
MRKIADILKNTAERFPDRVLFRMNRGGIFREWKYKEVMEYVQRAAGFLKDKGINKGDKIAVLGENRPEWGISYFSIHWIGAVCIPLDSRASPSDWEHFLRHSGARGIFVSSRYLEDIFEYRENLKDLEIVICMDNVNREGVYNFDEVIYYENKIDVPEEVDFEDLAIVLYTSGTTGTSKGVMLTHKNIISDIEGMVKVYYFDENDRLFSVLPLHHVFEQVCGFLTPCYKGASITYSRSLKPKELLEDLKATEPTVFLTVPLLLEKLYMGIFKNVERAGKLAKVIFNLLLKIARALNPITKGKASEILFKRVRERMGFGKIRYIVSGGAALPEWVERGFRELGFPIYQGYGLSETSPVVSVVPPDRPKIKSVGPPIPGVEVKIMDPGPDGIGEIAVKGDIVMRGYYKDEEATKRVFKGEWFLTGDIGYIDEDGYIYITGRKKSVIVTKGGKNIYPEEIEYKLLQSPLIKECLVLARIHPKTKTEIIHAIIYPDYEAIDERAGQEGKDVTESLIQKWIQEEIDKVNLNLADYKKIKSFALRDEEFPKTTTQKIKRYLFEQGGIEL